MPCWSESFDTITAKYTSQYITRDSATPKTKQTRRIRCLVRISFLNYRCVRSGSSSVDLEVSKSLNNLIQGEQTWAYSFGQLDLDSTFDIQYRPKPKFSMIPVWKLPTDYIVGVFTNLKCLWCETSDAHGSGRRIALPDCHGLKQAWAIERNKTSEVTVTMAKVMDFLSD
jgi:hypothetical protein